MDSDGDGTPNFQDDDSDNDNVADEEQKGPETCCAPLPGREGRPTDTDGDGIPDYLDPDSDDDGIPDVMEQRAPVAKAGGGRLRRLPQEMMSLDTDGDGLPNYLDLDSDGDGISDFIEKGPANCCLGNGKGGVGQPVDTGKTRLINFFSIFIYWVFLKNC